MFCPEDISHPKRCLLHFRPSSVRGETSWRQNAKWVKRPKFVCTTVLLFSLYALWELVHIYFYRLLIVCACVFCHSCLLSVTRVLVYWVRVDSSYKLLKAFWLIPVAFSIVLFVVTALCYPNTDCFELKIALESLHQFWSTPFCFPVRSPDVQDP